MVDTDTVRKIALSFEETVEQPHFELTSFRVNKKIFVTMDAKKQRICVMLNPIDQSAFTTFDATIIYPVPNKWGLKGATYIELKKVKKETLKDALTQAYIDKAPGKLGAKYRL